MSERLNGVNIYEVPNISLTIEDNIPEGTHVESNMILEKGNEPTERVIDLNELPVMSMIAVPSWPDSTDIRKCFYDEETNSWYYNEKERNANGRVKFKKGLPVLKKVYLPY